MTPDDLYYPRQAYVKTASAFVKPSSDIEDLLESLGAHGIGLKRAYLPNRKVVHVRNFFHHALAKLQLPRNKTVVLQYPSQYHIADLFKAAKRRGNKVILVVHDINRLRGIHTHNYDNVLQGADVVIVHTPAMQRWFNEQYPGKKSIVLEVFDYIQPIIPQAQAPADKATIVFAGNLGKSTFLSKFNLDGKRLKLVLYGVGCPETLKEQPFVDYRGSCMPEEIPGRIAANTYGLVWDGTSVDTCDGSFGKYLEYNAPYKLSSYLAAGLPVIVWSKMGIAPFVTGNKLGIAVDSLKDIDDVISGITPEQYQAMRGNVRAMQLKVSAGDFARNAITRALDLL